ncbi:MAG TPA: enoyl-CoA hydratase-related protein [Burkholderiaceae bacterium]|nr:enoyl-CoA hydratase-related protein [Burkholderiaceae bacterium]
MSSTSCSDGAVMLDTAFVTASVADGLACLSLHRPPVNVLDIATMQQMSAALDALATDAATRLLMICGSGDKAFSAGVEVADHTPEKVDRMIEIFHSVIRKIKAFPVPTLAAVNGAALGGGLEVALACDLIVAASGAKLGQPEIKLGVFPPVAAVLLPRLLPPVHAHELLYGGGVITAEQALAYGLVNRVFARTSFSDETRAYAAPFLELSRAALASTRKAVRAAADCSFDAGLVQAETIYLNELMKTYDAGEGLAAFLAKRKPVWQNK